VREDIGEDTVEVEVKEIGRRVSSVAGSFDGQKADG
jgi:hypothetical protein